MSISWEKEEEQEQQKEDDLRTQAEDITIKLLDC
jgi:hypothetical protein